MSTPAVRVPTINTPSLQGVDVMQSLRDRVADQINAGQDITPPSSAVEFTDRISWEYFDRPAARARARTMGPHGALERQLFGSASPQALQPSGTNPARYAQDERMRNRRDALANTPEGRTLMTLGMSLTGGVPWFLSGPVADRFGGLSEEEGQEAHERLVKEAKETEAAVERNVQRQQDIRAAAAQNADDLGFGFGGSITDDPEELELVRREQEKHDAQRLKEAADAVSKTESAPAPTKARWVNILRGSMQSLYGVGLDAARGAVYLIGEALPDAMGGTETGKSEMRGFIDAVDAAARDIYPIDKAYNEEFWMQLAQGYGSMIGYMSASVVAGSIGLPGAVGVGVVAGLGGGARQVMDAEQHGVAGARKLATFMAGSALGLSELVPIDRMLFRANQATGGLVQRMLDNTTAGSLEEFIQELVQSLGEDVIATFYDESRTVDMGEAFRNAAIGGIVGGTTGAATTALGGAIGPQGRTTRDEPELAPEQQEQIVDLAIAEADTRFEAIAEQMEAEAVTVLPEIVVDGEADVDVDVEAPPAAGGVDGDAEVAPDPSAADDLSASPAPAAPTAIADQLVEQATEQTRPATQVAEDFVRQLPREPLFQYDTVEAAGGTVPAPDADGFITLSHYSIHPRDTIDPAQMGTGPVRGVERQRLSGDDAVPRSYYGVYSGDHFVEPSQTPREYVRLTAEERAAATRLGRIGVTARAIQQALEARYRQEARQAGYRRDVPGHYRHEVKVRAEELYNVNEDPLNLRSQLPADRTANERVTRYERLIRDAGFRGAYFPSTELGQTAILFDAAQPAQIIDERYGLPTSELARPEEFNREMTPDVFQKGGWGVVTATREADGAGTDEVNVKANERLRRRLTRNQIPFVEVAGSYQGTPQGESFLVFAPEAQIRKLGEAFGQESVLTNRGLEYTDGRLTPVDPAQTVVGDEARALDFFSELPDGTAFSLGLDFDATVNERLAEEISSVELDPVEMQPLPGNSSGRPVESVVRAARAYAKSIGIPARRQATYVKADPERGARIAAAYEAMEHNPTDPRVAAAFQAMIDETLAQYQYVKASGLKVDFIEEGQADPYPDGPKQVLEDLERGHLWVFPTDSGFGSQGALTDADIGVFSSLLLDGTNVDGGGVLITLTPEEVAKLRAAGVTVTGESGTVEVDYASAARINEDRDNLNAGRARANFTEANVEADNPLLAPTDEYVGDRQLLANDVFRIVHDFFGHGIEGSGFGARGEENAWQSHMRLYTEAALPAVTSETRGQNSWVNFGPYGEQNRANQRETVYADQKTGIMPSWTWREGVADEFVDYGAEDLLGARAPSPEVAARLMEKVPGFEGVVGFLTEEELENMRASSAQKIVDMFTNLPSAEEMASVAIAGSAKRGWYARSAQALVDIFGIEDAPRFAALLAALSPQTSVEANAVNALNVWTAWVRAGRPTDERRIRSILNYNVQGGGRNDGKSAVLDAWVNNSIRSLTAPDPTTIKLSGPKVDSFMLNLRGVTNEVTNDTWMANYAFIDQSVFAAAYRKDPSDTVSGKMGGKGFGYKAFSAAVRNAAEVASDITGETWTPAEIQETVWSWAKAVYENTSNEISAEQLLELGRITDDMIAATPDFATLFTDGIYREILEQGGYDLGQLEAAEGSGQSDAGTSGRSILEAPEGAAIDGGAYEAHLRRAARRLDTLRRSRAGEDTTQDIDEDSFARPDEALEGISDEALEGVTDEDLDAFYGATASNRSSYRAEQSRPKSGVAGEATPDKAELRLSKIAEDVIRLMDLTVRIGRFTLRGANVMGQYSRRSGAIRLRSQNDLSTLVHEAGHDLQANANGELESFIKANEGALIVVARGLYGGDVSNMKRSEQIAEGFAEFFRVFVLNRAYTAKKHNPLYTQFTEILERTEPTLLAGLDAIGDAYMAWLQLPSAQIVRNMVVSGERDSALDEALAELQEQGFSTWMNEYVRRATSQISNKFAHLNDLVATMLNIAESKLGGPLDLKAAEDPRKLIRMAANSGNRAMVQLTDGVMGYRSTKPFTRSLREALLRIHGMDPDANLTAIDTDIKTDFAAYTIALRGLDEYRRFREGLIERPPVAATIGDLRRTVKEMEAKYGDDFREGAAIVNEYGMGLWRKMYEAGLMTRESYQDGLTRQFYVPLQRDMGRDASISGISAASAGQGNSVVKRFRGSDRDIIDPMDALMQKTISLEKVIAENEAKKVLASLADRVGQAGALVERIPAHKLVGTSYDVKDIARQLTKDDTLTEADAQDLMTILEASIEEGNRIAMFTSQKAAAKGENILFFWEDGKLAAIQLKDGDIGADIVNVMNGVGIENLPVLAELVAYTSGAFRAAITSWPDFLLVNFIRDQMSAWILTDVGYKPFVTGLQGVGDELRQGEWARQYNAAMGIMGGMNSVNLHKARVDRDINALRSKGYFVTAFNTGGSKIGNAIRGMARVTELTETGTRLGIFRKTYEKAKADGLTDWEASVEAAYNATDYIDFGLHGSKMMVYRRLVPFLNAQLQGLAKMMRTLGGDEVRQRKGLNFVLRAYFKDINQLPLSRAEKNAVRTGRKAWLKMSALGLISAALWAAYSDEPDYQDASEYLRATGWVIPLGNGRIFYIPKPFELAMIANIVERGLEASSGDKEAKNRLLRGMAMNLSPPVAPPAIAVAVEQTANYSFFGGREIVPDYMLALAPELQYNHTTSTFAKELGQLMGWSPMRVDHVLNSMGASAYRDVTSMINTLDPNRPNSNPTDWPITRRFYRDSRRGSTSSQDFWKQASQTDGKLRRAEVTYKQYMRAGQPQAADEFLRTLKPEERAYAILHAEFKTDAKRLHPMYRVRQLNTITSGMRREMLSDLGVENTGPFGEALKLPSSTKAKLTEHLAEYNRREVRNTMIYMNEPGWANKQPMPTEPLLELIYQTSPDFADEMQRRIKKAKVYNSDTVQEYWPEVRDRVLMDGKDATLVDILAIAKATAL